MTGEITNEQVVSALRRARIPASAVNYRLKNYGPDCTRVHSQFAEISDEDLADFWKSGKGWIIQGTTIKAREAFHTFGKLCLLIGRNVCVVRGVGKELSNGFDDDLMQPREAGVIGVQAFYDKSYTEAPVAREQRYDSEQELIDLIQNGATPLIHCVGRFVDCHWYSSDLLDLLTERCDIITAGK